MYDVDYYQILQVEPDAAASDIREAYYRLIQTRYTQRGKDIETAIHIQQVSEAYLILGNPHRRAKYDLERQQSSDFTQTSGEAAFNTDHPSAAKRPAWRPRPRWYLMACILLLGGAAVLSAVLQGLYWVPVLTIVLLCVLMNLMAILLTRDSSETIASEGTDESTRQLQA
jgi:Flp pilus assembly protein TadB